MVETEAVDSCGGVECGSRRAGQEVSAPDEVALWRARPTVS